MKLSRSKLFCTLAIIFVVIVARAFWKTNDPHYNGRLLSEWFQDLSEDDAHPAEAAVARFGKAAVPFLLARIEPSKPAVQESLKDWFVTRVLGRPNIRFECGLGLASDRWKEDLRLSRAFSALGTNAIVALPQLEKLLREPDASHSAAVALVSIGSPSLPVLSNALNSADAEIRSVVVNNLGKIRSGKSEAAELLFKTLQDSDPLMRHYAAYAVGELNAQPEKSVQFLIKALEDSDPRVRYISVYALKRFGFSAHASVPALTNLLTDQEENIREGAAEVIEALNNSKNETSIK